MLKTQDVHVVVRGDVAPRKRRFAQECVAKVTRYVADPVLFARVTLTTAANPAQESPAVARAVLDLNGHVLRAATAAPSMHEAIKQLHDGLRHQVEHLADRRVAERRRGRPQ